jgi:6-phosphofructokinase
MVQVRKQPLQQSLLRYVNIGRIGILTSGGDLPGLNAVIKIVTYRGSEDAIEVIGRRRGWEALTHQRRRFGRAVATVRGAMNLSSWRGERDREEDV